MIKVETCRCGSSRTYRDCCQPYHTGAQLSETAETLMRSRFTAYALRKTDYLLASWDSSKRPDSIDFSKEQAEWTRLEIISTKKGQKSDQKGLVEFKAYYLQDNQEYVMHELSRFKKTEGQWFYIDGLVKSVGKTSIQTHQGKNAPCPCGSGKKFKRCCGK